MIVKDDSEADILRRALKSVHKYVDGIFITGTKNPQKKIKKIVKEYNGKWSWFKWTKNFSEARNFNLSQVPKEYDYMFWMDTDDIVVGAEKFPQLIEMMAKEQVTALFARYLYQVELDEKGNVKQILIEHLRERILKNDNIYKWVAPIHETLIEQRPGKASDTKDFLVVHMIKAEEMAESMWRNIEILEEEVVNNPTDPRPIYYLAKAYFDTHEPQFLYEPVAKGMDSYVAELIKNYISMSGWAEERAQAWEYLAMIHREQGDFKRAISALLEALTEDPKFTSCYVQIALTYVMLKDWAKALHWVKVAGGIEIPKTTLVINPRDYKTMLLEAMFHIYLNTGQLELCHKVATEMVNIIPTDASKQRFKDIDDLKHRNDMAHWAIKLASHLKETGQFAELTALIQGIPQEIAGEPALIGLRNEFLPPRKWGDDEIAIYCGPHFEKWSPKSTSTGIGGSEEAVIYLSKELAKLGWRVTVFADPREDTGVYDGVRYLPHFHINWKDELNIFVAWRQIQLMDVPGLKTKKSYLWNHDLQNPMTYTPERVNKLHKALFLSKFHRTNVPDLPEDKIFYTANGINI